jgi:ribosome-binding factor A
LNGGLLITALLADHSLLRMATTRRQERINHLLQKQVSSLLEFELSDPRLQGLTVSAVEISPDLRHARVFIVAVGDPEREKEIRHGLQSAVPFVRRELARRVQLRIVPELDFAFDHSIEQGDRIERLLREAQRATHDEE